MARVPPLDASPDEVRETLRPLRADFSVALWSAGNAFALGAIVRVAHNFLAREIIVIGDEAGNLVPRLRHGWYEKASMGMEKFESIVRVKDEAAFFAHAGARPIWALEKDAARRSITSVDQFPRDVIFLFGSERFDIPPEVLARCHEIIGIPIYGVNHSLPLAVAAGIVMHEHARRRFVPGAVL